jgi:hypothetical protein
MSDDPVLDPPTSNGPEPETAGESASPEADSSLLDEALDLLVFAPAGMVVMATEELPTLVTKGRTRIETQIRTARFLGQMTVTFAVTELRTRGARFAADLIGPKAAGTPSDASASGEAAGAGSQADADDGTAPAAGDDLETASGTAWDPAVGDLAIPGYDALSASQVVRRLEGLGPQELEAVYRYELSSRQRRTVLHRAQQLLGHEVPPEAPDADEAFTEGETEADGPAGTVPPDQAPPGPPSS